MGEYVTGLDNNRRDLLDIGVIEGADMLPEVALVKMMWVLGNERNRRK